MTTEEFERLMFSRINGAIGRINTFNKMDNDIIKKMMLCREILMLSDKLFLLDPEAFANAQKMHSLGHIRNRHGFCESEDCHNEIIRDFREWAKYPTEIQCFLDQNCVKCATAMAQECADEDELDSVGD